jgi:hypothetical protein
VGLAAERLVWHPPTLLASLDGLGKRKRLAGLECLCHGKRARAGQTVAAGTSLIKEKLSNPSGVHLSREGRSQLTPCLCHGIGTVPLCGVHSFLDGQRLTRQLCPGTAAMYRGTGVGACA